MKISVLATYVAENYGFGVWRERSQQVFLTKDVIHAGVVKGHIYDVEVVENARDVTGNTPWLAAHLYPTTAQEELERQVLLSQVEKDAFHTMDFVDLPALEEAEVIEEEPRRLHLSLDDETKPSKKVLYENIDDILNKEGRCTTRRLKKLMQDRFPNADLQRHEVRNRVRTMHEQGKIVKTLVFRSADRRASYTVWSRTALEITGPLTFDE